ncbi:MAG TPA: hypothetical protein VGR09_14680, partial [Gemmatimonadales bacterium]|nr:hypothetical protein [Gemmatimonadales bacterium]
MRRLESMQAAYQEQPGTLRGWLDAMAQRDAAARPPEGVERAAGEKASRPALRLEWALAAEAPPLAAPPWAAAQPWAARLERVVAPDASVRRGAALSPPDAIARPHGAPRTPRCTPHSVPGPRPRAPS